MTRHWGRGTATDVIRGHPASAGSVNPCLGATVRDAEDHSEGEISASDDEERIQGEEDAVHDPRARLDAGDTAVRHLALGQPGKSVSVSVPLHPCLHLF